MTIQIIGAGFGRTGTHSLKVALERLLGGTCHHMVEVFNHPDEVAVWNAATRGEMPDWGEFLSEYSAIVDWPGAAFWPELMAAFPDVPVVLSTRSAESWWRSADNTIFVGIRDGLVIDNPEWHAMVMGMLARHGITDLNDADLCKARFEENLRQARAKIPAHRLVEWTATDGWGPLCAALGVAEPDEPFPLTNTTEEFRQLRLGADAGATD
jgi:hypothetical protein